MPRLELRFLSAEDVLGLGLTDAEVLGAVEGALRAHGLGEVVQPPKSHLVLDDRFGGHLNILPGYVAPLGTAGVKVIADYVGNHAHDLPSEPALLILHRPETGVPTAILDATRLTWLRTGAVTGIGARHLARPGARVLAHVGARGTAGANLRFLAEALELDEIRVTSRRAESRERFAERMTAELGRPVRAVATVREAVEGADVVVDASRLEREEVLVRTEWLAPGALVVPYGAVRSTEATLPVVADRFVVDDWAQASRPDGWGQYCRAIADGIVRREHLHAELGQVVAGLRPGRESDDELVVLWHRGMAVCDVAIGALALTRAQEQGIGTVLTYQAAAREE